MLSRSVLRALSNSASAYDLVVIGGGPGGYVCAIRAAQLGLKTACIEKRATLGGTCLNVGCIPSKVLLNASNEYHTVKSGVLSKMGISVESSSLDLHQMMSFKDRTVSGLSRGIDSLFKKYGVDRIVGEGSFNGKIESNFKIAVTGEEDIMAKKVVIATGSVPNMLPCYDGKDIVTSDEAIAFERVPEKLVVVGGGVIGVEIGSIWNRLGSHVTVIDSKSQFSPGCDMEISQIFHKILQKQGIFFKVKSKLKSVSNKTVQLDTGEVVPFDKLLLAIGRRPNTTNLNLSSVGLSTTPNGMIETISPYNETKTQGIFAIGDVAAGPMLAHKAEDEGVVVAHFIGDKKIPASDHRFIPSVVYTDPEVAWVGEISASESNRSFSFPFSANSRARATAADSGLVKVTVDENGKLVGAQILGKHAGELISTLSLAIKYGANARDIADLSFPHPTLSEALKEACLAADWKPIHF